MRHLIEIAKLVFRRRWQRCMRVWTARRGSAVVACSTYADQQHLLMPPLRPVLVRPTMIFSYLVFSFVAGVGAEPITSITIDGDFGDWGSVPSYFDVTGGTNHAGTDVPDVHDTDHHRLSDVPTAVSHPDVDLLEYKFTHDEDSLYAYFRAAGQIGATQVEADGNGRAGRYYAIVTIDVDNDDDTGYWLHEGGYYPTSNGYDMNMEAEFYDGQLNTAHYLSHDALNSAGLRQDFVDLTAGAYSRRNPGPYSPGFVQPAPGNYENYTQWVYHNDDTLTLVEDRGPIVPGIMLLALSGDGHELEMQAPFKGFLNDSLGNPNMALGKTIDISFSLEASGELAPGDRWASDTGNPIIGYMLEGPTVIPEPSSLAALVCALFGLLPRQPKIPG